MEENFSKRSFHKIQKKLKKNEIIERRRILNIRTENFTLSRSGLFDKFSNLLEDKISNFIYFFRQTSILDASIIMNHLCSKNFLEEGMVEKRSALNSRFEERSNSRPT